METYEKLKPHVNMREHENEDLHETNKEFKIIIIGDSAVGKTSMCERFCMNEFSLEIKPSKMVECYPKLVKIFNTFVRVYLINLSVEKFDSVAPEITKETHGAIIVYDITKEQSYNKIDSCYEKLKAKFGINLPFMIIGNKNDLINLRNVGEDEAYEKSVALNCDYCETSCLEDEEEKGNQFNQSENYCSVTDAINLMIARVFYMSLPEAEKEKLESICEKEENDKQKE